MKHTIKQVVKKCLKKVCERAGLCRSGIGEEMIGNLREIYSYKYLSGHGIEIGALHNPVKLFGNAKVEYVDYLSVENLRKAYPELKYMALAPVSIVDDGEKLTKIAGETQDFVIANHMLEHVQDPISTIKNFLRVLKPEGVVYLSVPDKRYEFDYLRGVTSYEHIINDYTSGPRESYDSHLIDWYTYVEGEEFNENSQIDHLKQQLSHIHFHVWDFAAFLSLLQNLIDKKLIDCEIVAATRNGIENLFILKKCGNVMYTTGDIVEYNAMLYICEGEALRHIVDPKMYELVKQNANRFIKIENDLCSPVIGLPLSLDEIPNVIRRISKYK